MPRKTPNPGLPSRQQILDFIQQSGQPAGKREIARAFGLHGHDKIMLKSLLKDMADEGLIDSSPGRAFHKAGGVPKVTVLRVVEVEDGAVAVPDNWQGEGPPPKLRVIEKGQRSALALNDRILARTEERGQGHVAHLMKKLAKSTELLLGVVHQEGEGRFWLKPVDKRERREFPISELGDAQVGDLVLAEPSGRPPRVSARVDAVLGDPFAPRSFSLIAIHKHGLPHEFKDETIEEAGRVARLPLSEIRSAHAEPVEARAREGGSQPPFDKLRVSAKGDSTVREDLRHLPIVAIDPADARDHDDAIWAEARAEGGWNAIVAIADVSYYVRPGSSLDREARRRGNSVYFPDRVVPMLPHELSSDICSLKEGQDRAAMACHLVVAEDGSLKSWRFTRAVIRVAANIAYEDAQAAIDQSSSSPLEEVAARSADGGVGATGADPSVGFADSSPKGEQLEVSSSPCSMPEIEPSARTVSPELVDIALKPLWSCWTALLAARNRREPLELDLPERQISLDEKGRILSVAPRERLDSHRLVEDFMIAANVAAAKALETKKAPVMYRDHEAPGREKLVALKDYLATFDLEFALGQVVKPATFNRIIDRVGDSDARPEIMEQLLRTQTQARYSPDPLGHFGLALGSYAHFTSPIRRYADLLVHRVLVSAYRLGEGGLPAEDATRFTEIGESISQLERRAMEAERETVDRYVAAYLADHVGELVDARVTGVQPFGFFATVEGLGGDGLVLAKELGNEYFRYDEKARLLVGEDSGESYRVGQRLKLRLVEANPISGALRFELPEGRYAMPPRKDRTRRPPVGKRGRPANIRHQGRRK